MPGPMRYSEKAQKGTFKKSIGKLLKYCKRYWGWMIVAILLGGVGVATQIIGPVKIQDLTTTIITGLMQGGIDTQAVINICLFLMNWRMIQIEVLRRLLKYQAIICVVRNGELLYWNFRLLVGDY